MREKFFLYEMIMGALYIMLNFYIGSLLIITRDKIYGTHKDSLLGRLYSMFCMYNEFSKMFDQSTIFI